MSNYSNFRKYDKNKSCNTCDTCNNSFPTQTNLATVNQNTQTVPDKGIFTILGSTYQNKITFLDPNTIKFCRNGLYSIQFVLSASATQPGPFRIGFTVNGGAFAEGVVKSTSTGLEITGIGFVQIDDAPTTGQLINYSGQSIDIDYLRLTIIKLS